MGRRWMSHASSRCPCVGPPAASHRRARRRLWAAGPDPSVRHRCPHRPCPRPTGDYARLSASDLNETLSTIERLLDPAGVSLSWQRCSPGDARGPSSCHKPLLPGDLALRLLENVPQSMESDAALRLGFAVLDRDGAGVLASVYLNRVGRLGRVSRTSANRLAGWRFSPQEAGTRPLIP